MNSTETKTLGETSYRDILDATDKGFCIIEVLFEDDDPADVRFLEVNEAFEELTGIDDPVGARMRDRRPQTEEFWFEEFGEVAATGESVSVEHEAAPLAGGWYEANAFPLGGEESNRVGIIFDDITERKRAERRLERAHDQKSEFLATLEHELRNPLAPITNAIKLLEQQADETDRVREATEMLDRHVEQMTRVLDDLLDLSRLNEGKIELDRETVELDAFIEDVVAGFEPRFRNEGLDFEVSLPADPIRIDVDPTRIFQVVSNLLDNACKFTEGGCSVRLTVERESSEAVIRVEDEGIGIAQEKMPGLFDSFEKIETPLDPSHEGLGVGLTLVKTLVELHDGTISVESEGRGHGSCFLVRLPLEASSSAEPSQQEPSDESAPRRVLVVDDKRDVADSLQAVLELDGHEVRCAYNGQGGLEIASEFAPDVVVLDLGLPDIDGLEVCRRLRNQPAGGEAFIIAATGWGQDSDRRRTEDAGFDEHYVKPIDIAEIEERIADFFGE